MRKAKRKIALDATVEDRGTVAARLRGIFVASRRAYKSGVSRS
jgi:hypothetical protein